MALVLFLAACRGRASTAAAVRDGGDDADMADWPRARALAEGRAVLPQRADALALARRIEGRAAREGAGARAVSLHFTAARVLERVWRAAGRDEDAREALDEYRAASRDVSAEGACEAALEEARLNGDLTADGGVRYAELYRAHRRFGDPPNAGARPIASCRHDLGDALARLAASRPPQAALDAIDRQLAMDGEIARLQSDSEATAARPPEVVRIESWPGRDTARVVLVVDRPVVYRVGDESGGDAAQPRVFVDLDGVDLGPGTGDTPAQGLLTLIRAESVSTGSRVWLHLDGHAWRHVFEMQQPYRIVIDVARHPPGVQASAPRAVSRVVLDPGHGGSDHGARGPTGIEEKDVAVDIARRVAPVFAAQGIQVALTREDDRFVSLEERAARANAFGADLFISIHCNASESKAPRGVEMYVLDTSRDEIAARVAARENATTQAASAELGAILGGLRMSDGARRSKRLAHLLLRASTTALQTKYGDAVDGGTHAAGFYVLVGARMPAVLFETSYISNPLEEQRLASAEYRQLLADAIANGVRAYREGR